ncbi:MAG: hypothetical protein QFB87_00260 [Patescibacteria group bacterium]|nr:hypothetical protein [Patescibacteria group bacterium]
MIQFNLLPDIKLEYIKAKRLKQTMVSISVLVASGSMVVAILLFLGVNVAQKKHMNDLNKQITAAATKLQATPDLNKIITVQNQLESLTALHNKKLAPSRLYDYVSQVTPNSVSIASIATDFTASNITISGSAKDLLAINTYIDTLKFTGYTSDATGSQRSPAFSKVLLASFSSGEKSASYQITMAFDPIIFDNQQKITLKVPNTITTRSQLDGANALFQPATVTKTGIK